MSPYQGNENYIFVSYAHKDQDIVVPIIEALSENGFRVWFDLGIEAGTVWPAFIQERLKSSKVVLAFISPSSIASKNCRKEINLALNNDKEMLAIHLQETELLYGMELQLEAVQAMFMYKQPSTEIFFKGLFEAKILNSCKIDNTDGALISEKINITSSDFLDDFIKKQKISTHNALDFENLSDLDKAKALRKNGPALISTVGVKGTNDPNDSWPASRYSQVISMDEYSRIRFHCVLMKSMGIKSTKKVGYHIFDAKGSLVYEYEIELDFEPTYDRFSLAWNINIPDSVPVLPGKYTVLMWIDNSRAFEYHFRITSSGYEAEEDTTTNNKKFILNQVETQKQIEEIKRKLAYPNLAFWAVLNYIVGLIAIFVVGLAFSNSVEGDGKVIFYLFSIAVAIFCICVFAIFYKKTKATIGKNGFVSFILVIFGSLYYFYIVYLVFMAITTLIRKKSLKAKLTELEKGLL